MKLKRHNLMSLTPFLSADVPAGDDVLRMLLLPPPMSNTIPSGVEPRLAGCGGCTFVALITETGLLLNGTHV